VNARNDALLLWSHVFALSWIETQAKNNDRRFGLKKSHVTAAARSKKKKKTGHEESGVGNAQGKRCKMRDSQVQNVF